MKTMRYDIVYIDEELNDRNDMRDKFKDDPELNLTVLPPEEDLENFVKNLIDSNYDALIVDYQLMEYNPKIKYDGLDFLKTIHEIKEEYPVIILTDYEEDARNNAVKNDVNPRNIFDKRELKETEKLPRKIKSVIDYYKNHIEDLKNRINELKQKEKEGILKSKEESELIDKDSELERRINKKVSLDKTLKGSLALKSLNNILEETEKYLKEISKGKN